MGRTEHVMPGQEKQVFDPSVVPFLQAVSGTVTETENPFIWMIPPVNLPIRGIHFAPIPAVQHLQDSVPGFHDPLLGPCYYSGP